MIQYIAIFNTIASILWIFQIFFAHLNVRFQKKILSQKLDHTPRLSVVIPVFNELPEVFQKVLCSLFNQTDILLDVIVIDDGSSVPVVIDGFPGTRLIRMETNVGKRKVQVIGFELARHDWVVTLDSDTVLNANALYELYKTAILLQADAVGGTIYLENEKKNWLTKMTSCMYWFSFFQERSSQSYFNVMTCCSGALSIYKKDTLLKCTEDYLNQSFMGQSCIAGDDRHLTNMFVRMGKKVCWSYFSRGYTLSPESFGGFVKQQLRWSRSHTAAVYYIAQHVKEFHPMFVFFITKMMFRYIYFVALYLLLVERLVVNQDVMFLATVGLTVLGVSVIKSVIAWLYTREWKFLWLLFYGIMSFFVFTPLLFYGLITPLKTSWLTRNKRAQHAE